MATQPETQEEQGVDETPAGQYRRWVLEFSAARKPLKRFHTQGDKVVARFIDERETGSNVEGQRPTDTRLNLFTSNIQTIRCILYGKMPKTDASRRYSDSADDVARVSSEMLERALNADLPKDGDTFAEACGAALDDRLLPGGGFNRHRYVVETGEEVTPAIPDSVDPMTGLVKKGAPEVRKQVKTKECVETDYVYWKDVLWDSSARLWRNLRWVAFKAPMGRDALIKRFGKDVGGKVPLSGQQQGQSSREATDSDKTSPWGRADVWEVWSKEDRKVYWLVEGFPELLDTQEDPLGLEGFFPCQKPMMANLTTKALVPTADFVIAQDLYDEIDLVSNRITLLERAVSVRGLYDKSNKEVQRLLSEGGQNELIPADNWQLLIEKGGLQAAVMWMPLEMIVNALNVLREYRTELTTLSYQVTGMSDIVRGQAQTQTTATEQSIKAKFASVRLQALQDEFAEFCSGGQRIRMEIMAKHFDAKTLLDMANMAMTPDAKVPGLLEQAVALIKSDHLAYRVEVKPESVSLTDYAALKQERMEVLQSIGGYIQMVQPLVMQAPQMAPMAMQLLQWLVSGIRGSQEIEGILDQAISQAQQAAQAPQQPQGPPPPDPRLQHEALKQQGQQQHTQMELEADLQRTQAETQAAVQQEAAKAHFGMMADAAKERSKTLQGIDAVLGNGGGQ